MPLPLQVKVNAFLFKIISTANLLRYKITDCQYEFSSIYTTCTIEYCSIFTISTCVLYTHKPFDEINDNNSLIFII